MIMKKLFLGLAFLPFVLCAQQAQEQATQTEQATEQTKPDVHAKKRTALVLNSIKPPFGIFKKMVASLSELDEDEDTKKTFDPLSDALTDLEYVDYTLFPRDDGSLIIAVHKKPQSDKTDKLFLFSANMAQEFLTLMMANTKRRSQAQALAADKALNEQTQTDPVTDDNTKKSNPQTTTPQPSGSSSDGYYPRDYNDYPYPLEPTPAAQPAKTTQKSESKPSGTSGPKQLQQRPGFSRQMAYQPQYQIPGKTNGPRSYGGSARNTGVYTSPATQKPAPRGATQQEIDAVAPQSGHMIAQSETRTPEHLTSGRQVHRVARKPLDHVRRTDRNTKNKPLPVVTENKQDTTLSEKTNAPKKQETKSEAPKKPGNIFVRSYRAVTQWLRSLWNTLTGLFGAKK